jgi:argininosuccinate lyase
MPQKRNPDVMELARGKAGPLLGDLVAMLATLKGTPSGYNKDLQEDKAVLFRAFDTLGTLLPAVEGTVRTLTVDEDRCQEALEPALMATDLADALVERGVPFRTAHEVVGKLLLAVEASGKALNALSSREAGAVHPELTHVDLARALDPVRSVKRRASTGGTAPERVREQLRALRERLA